MLYSAKLSILNRMCERASRASYLIDGVRDVEQGVINNASDEFMNSEVGHIIADNDFVLDEAYREVDLLLSELRLYREREQKRLEAEARKLNQEIGLNQK